MSRTAPHRDVRLWPRAIYAVQHNLEDVQAALYPERMQLCDRGTIDGAAYWPEGPADFFAAMGTTRRDELARYNAVLVAHETSFLRKISAGLAILQAVVGGVAAGSPR